MHSAGTVPPTRTPFDDLVEIATGEGPFLSVHLVADGAVEGASRRAEQRWQSLRRTLSEAGAPEEVLEAVDPLVGDAHLLGRTMSVIAGPDGTRVVEHHAEPLRRDRWSWGPVPDLLPLIRHRQSHPPFVAAYADRGGADLYVERGGRPVLPGREVGSGDPERKSSAGGWSQPRYQRHAEGDWAHTAAEVATEVAKLAERFDARLVVIGGDVRATHLIRDALPDGVAARAHLIGPGRAADGSESERDFHVHRLVATAVAEDTVAVLERHKEELGRLDRACEGASATVDALNQGAVDVLLVSDRIDSREVWVGAGPVPIAFRESGVVGSEEPPQRAPLVATLVRAALATGASVRVVPHAGPLAEGIGAILRWSQ